MPTIFPKILAGLAAFVILLSSKAAAAPGDLLAQRQMWYCTDFPAGKEGYLAWRREQARRHGARIAGIMADAGYDTGDQVLAGVLLRKEGLKRDADVQALEDVICFVFLRWYLSSFAQGRDQSAVLDIVTKTARKMSASGRARALVEFDLPEAYALALRADP